MTIAKVNNQVKSPLNYIGGKYKILSQILPLFPVQINQFVDLFAGGCNIGINAKAEKIYFNDNLCFLIEMYKIFKLETKEHILTHIHTQIQKFGLSLTNEEGYKALRKEYNQNKNPLDLFVLIAFSFNHQIRFNNNHEYNNPFGKDRSTFNATMRQNLERFLHKLQSINATFSCNNFDDFDFSILTQNDFVYCDPPYLITTGTYNDGKRGFTGWTTREEEKLLNLLDALHVRNIKFALSNVIEHKGQSNDLLKNWLSQNPNYTINYINMDYANSNYQTLVRDKNASVEVLITNYNPNIQTVKTLF